MFLKTFFVTSKGINFSGDNLSAIRKINLSTFQHDLVLASLLLRIEKELGIHIMTEREIQKELPHEFKHLPDGLHITEEGEYIIIELELTKKSYSRSIKILKGYRSSIKVQKIMYYVDNEGVKSYIMKLSKELNMDNLIQIKEIDPIKKLSEI